jgi:hypothetical protein
MGSTYTSYSMLGNYTMKSIEPVLTKQGAKEYASNMTAPKVTEESIKEKIAQIDYIYKETFTICLITMQNGFIVNGTSAPASKDNYNQEVGERFAYDNAFRQLWPLEGYLLRETLSQHEATETTATETVAA